MRDRPPVKQEGPFTPVLQLFSPSRPTSIKAALLWNIQRVESVSWIHYEVFQNFKSTFYFSVFLFLFCCYSDSLPADQTFPLCVSSFTKHIQGDSVTTSQFGRHSSNIHLLFSSLSSFFFPLMSKRTVTNVVLFFRVSACLRGNSDLIVEQRLCRRAGRWLMWRYAARTYLIYNPERRRAGWHLTFFMARKSSR